MTAAPHPPAERARALLAAYDLDAIGRWAAEEPRARRALQSLVFDPDEVVCWRAVEALGRVARARSARGLEVVRESLRRALWLMNDESGGLLWYGPQLMGAILANVPALTDEFVAPLASFLEEDPFRVGTRWALWRLATLRPAVVAGLAGDLIASLADPSAAVRGHAAVALVALRHEAASAALAALAADEATLSLFDYRRGTLRSVTVAAVARRPF